MWARRCGWGGPAKTHKFSTKHETPRGRTMGQDGMIGLRRRGLLTGAAVGALGLALPARAAGQLNVAAYGGVINDFLTTEFGAPFEQKTGIKVNFGTGSALALAKLQVAAGSPSQW